MTSQAFLLVLAVVTVGVLHTLVPDHWAPIVVLARQRGWTRWEASRAALAAGIGHTTTTLALGGVIWLAGAELGSRFGHVVEVASSVALVALGLWIAFGSQRELRRTGHGHAHGHHHGHGHDHGHSHHHGHHHHHHGAHEHDHHGERQTDSIYVRLSGQPVAAHHRHLHRHGRGLPHLHWHDHDGTTAHSVTAETTIDAPLHDHRHRLGLQAGLLILLGSSPMVEGLPAFFAASRYSVGVLVVMAAAFAVSTMATYVVLCSVSLAGLQRVKLGPLERYSELVSGLFIAIVGVAFWLWPVA